MLVALTMANSHYMAAKAGRGTTNLSDCASMQAALDLATAASDRIQPASHILQSIPAEGRESPARGISRSSRIETNPVVDISSEKPSFPEWSAMRISRARAWRTALLIASLTARKTLCRNSADSGKAARRLGNPGGNPGWRRQEFLREQAYITNQTPESVLAWIHGPHDFIHRLVKSPAVSWILQGEFLVDVPVSSSSGWLSITIRVRLVPSSSWMSCAIRCVHDPAPPGAAATPAAAETAGQNLAQDGGPLALIRRPPRGDLKPPRLPPNGSTMNATLAPWSFQMPSALQAVTRNS